MFTSGAENYRRLQYFLKSTRHLLERKVIFFQLQYSERIEYSTESVCLTFVSKLNYLGLFPCSSAEVGKILGLTIDFILTFWEKHMDWLIRLVNDGVFLFHCYSIFTEPNLIILCQKPTSNLHYFLQHQHWVLRPDSAREHVQAVLDNCSHNIICQTKVLPTQDQKEKSHHPVAKSWFQRESTGKGNCY